MEKCETIKYLDQFSFLIAARVIRKSGKNNIIL